MTGIFKSLTLKNNHNCFVFDSVVGFEFRSIIYFKVHKNCHFFKHTQKFSFFKAHKSCYYSKHKIWLCMYHHFQFYSSPINYSKIGWRILTTLVLNFYIINKWIESKYLLDFIGFSHLLKTLPVTVASLISRVGGSACFSISSFMFNSCNINRYIVVR